MKGAQAHLPSCDCARPEDPDDGRGLGPGPGSPVQEALRDPLLARVVETLDVGIVVTSVRYERVAYRNPLAETILARFGADPTVLPRAIADALRAAAPALTGTEGRFSRAHKVTSPDGRDYYARSCLLLAPTPRRLVTLGPAVVRDLDIQDLLQRRFGLSIQQARVAALLRTGLPNQLIATELGLSLHTIKRYVSEAMLILGLRRRAELSAFVERLCATHTPG